MIGLKYILHRPFLRKYSTVIALTIVTGISGLGLWHSRLISTNNLLQQTQTKNRSEKTIAQNLGWVYTVAITPDGQTLASGGYGGVIKIWDLNNNQLLHTINAHADAIESIAISPDGKILASGSWDNRIKLWDLTNGTLIRTIAGHIDDVKAIAISADGKILASGSYNGMIKLWNLKTGSIEGSFQHSAPITSLTFSSDGEILASGFQNGQIKTWQLNTGKQLHSLAAHQNTVWAIAFSPDGKFLASGSQDRTVKLWQVDTGQLQSIFEGHSQAVLSVAFSSDSQTLASGSYDRDIHLWQVNTEELLETLTGHSQAVWSLQFNPDSQTLASGSADGTIKLWSVSGLSHHELENATQASVVKKEAEIVVVSEITDIAQLEKLNQKLYDKIDQSWQHTPTWYEDLVFRVRVNEDGAIVSFESINQFAQDYTEQTPLPKLLSNANSKIVTQKQSFALFRVVMTPAGVLEVSPWGGWL
ncbi:WD40 repeat domain-containing protein [Okeania sp. SIO2B3]|uniref:WD40 repeat domain-containing protein n=1 Tax=Okeania sp. SIO2B3 TaxID=2607784 RepID=UPI0013C0EED1|nr:WD40 repeat domain-containing protein [Okeania sp. SIO2B3]NET41691.1 WD40 repeat domain-containing protein [Okeania sp. SIO2B3]